MTRLFGFNQGTGTATKNLNWNTGTNKPTYRVNSDGRAKPLPRLETKNNGVESRTATFLKLYWHNYNEFKENAWNVKVDVLTCIAWSETSLWLANKSSHNIFNCWNNDRWDTKCFNSDWEAIRYTVRYCLNWTYSKHKTTISHLYPNHPDSTCNNNRDEWCRYVYASSKDNAMNNVLNCLSLIHNKQIDPDFTIKTNWMW